jgi:hypothetical protein
MNLTMASGPGDLGWTNVEACTLPTAERPLRLADFDALFATTLQSIEQPDDTHARLLLAGDDSLSDRTQRLLDAESSCCSFFTFGVSTITDGTVVLDIAVPPAYADVLAGLVARAAAAQGAAS